MRKARVKAESGVYIVFTETLDKLLFIEDSDRREYLNLIGAYKEKDGFELYAFCLKDESVYLVVKEGLSGISQTIKNINSRYVGYLNSKYDKKGKLLKDRFKSQPLESGEEVKEAVRYVLQQKQSRTDVNSYEYYLKKNPVIDYSVFEFLFDSVSDYRIFMESDTQADFVGGEKSVSLTDSQLKTKIKEMFDGVQSQEVDALSPEQFKALIARIKQIEGASIRQIARLLNVSKSYVERA